MSLPNFFIAGAPKAGTDALYYDLDQHPEIFMSQFKEPCYFSSEIRLEYFDPSLRAQMEIAAESTRQYLDGEMNRKRFGGIVSDFRDYQRLFLNVRNEKAVGEGSVCYLWSEAAPGAIASAIPDARIIIVLMDPAERAFHQYLKSVSDGTVGHSFRKHLEYAMDHGPELGVYHPFLAFGNYFEQVRRYMSHFPPGQLNISLYEDTKADYQSWFSGVLRFLHVEDSFRPAQVEVPSKPHVPRFIAVSHALRIRTLKSAVGHVLPRPIKSFVKQLTKNSDLPRLSKQDRATLIRYYHDDILLLQELIKRDLSAWLC
jgi:hypothetical protein